MDGTTSRVIGTAALISVGVGTLNSFYKYHKPPSMRFLIGSGAAYVVLSAIGEGEPEVAKALAVAVAVTVVLGEGGGVLTYMDKGEVDTRSPRSEAEEAQPLTSSADLYPSDEGPFVPDDQGIEAFQYDGKVSIDTTAFYRAPSSIYRPDTIGLFPGMVTN